MRVLCWTGRQLQSNITTKYLTGTMDKPHKIFRFGPFQLLTRSQELYKHEIKLKFRPQPFQILNELLSRPGELVTREELRERLWSSETFVDFEQSLNTSVKEIRAVLGDSATEPHYVETVPRLGYRFIAPVEVAELPASKEAVPSVAPGIDPDGTHAPLPSSRIRHRFRVAALLAAVAIVAGVFAGRLWFHRRPASQTTPRVTIVLADFVNTTGEAVFDEALKQGLNVGLEQSPVFQMLTGEKSALILKQMGHPPDQPLTPNIAIEVCQRAGSKVTVQGSISSLGTSYLIGLTAIRCDNGDRIAQEQVEAKRKEDVIDALGKATSQLRSRIGESVQSVQKYDAPLQQVTTSSLEALKAYGLALATWDKSGEFAAVPALERAIELDPNFALAYSQLAAIRGNRDETDLARKYATKAYELRGRTTEFERLSIESWYHFYVTGDLEKATAAFETTRQTYPDEPRILNDLATIYGSLGLNEKAVAFYKDSLRVDPSSETTLGNLAVSLIALGRNDEAAAVLEETGKRGLQSDYLLQVHYWRAFLLDDSKQMGRVLSQAAGVPGAQFLLLSEQANTEAYSGHFRKARQLSLVAANQMQIEGQLGTAGLCLAQAALREAEVGESLLARDFMSRALHLTRDQNVRALAALIMARTGDPSKANSSAELLGKEYPTSTFIQKYWLPITQAESELHQGKALQAVDTLNPVEALDGATPGHFTITLLPAYTRGQAYLATGDGSKAAAEFQKLLDHPGMVLNFPLGALARLGVARAYAVQGHTLKAKAAYQDFLTLWQTADPNIPILIAAKAEYAKLH
jgi:DNA-binding winged helix-turn-helix (wHTH) protein/Flp pilus assembly protein TadD